MNKKIFITLLLLSLAHHKIARALEPLEAGDPQSQFQAANGLYEKGDFVEADRLYDAVLQKGFASAALFFNRGNIAYKKGNRGAAIAWYERAKREAPRDNDIRFNLNLARAHLKDEPGNALENVALFFSNTELGAALIIFLFLFFSVLSVRTLGYLRESLLVETGLWVSGFCLTGTFLWFLWNSATLHQPIGIVTAATGEGRLGPGLDHAVSFTIPEGSRVLVLDKRPDWLQVGLAHQGLKGWVPQKDVEVVSTKVGG